MKTEGLTAEGRGESGRVDFQQQEESCMRGSGLYDLSGREVWGWNSEGEKWEQNCCLCESSEEKN